MGNKLIILLDINNSNQELIEKTFLGIDIKQFSGILKDDFCKTQPEQSIGELNVFKYYQRNTTIPQQVKVVLEQSFTASSKEGKVVLLTGIRNAHFLQQIKQQNDVEVFVLAFTPSIEIIDNSGSFDKEVLDVYLQADYYLNPYLPDDKVQEEVSRFKTLIGVNAKNVAVSIPRETEINMFSAYNAMYRSHCLSRAVGASITTPGHELITTGWNDVPKAGGGVYGNNDKNHCFRFSNPKIDDKTKIPGCHKDIENKSIIAEIKAELNSQGITIGEKEQLILNEIEKMQIKGLLEFSRSVHAELHTIIKGSQMVGDKIKGSILYVTAFPCHNCARHIILAGVKTVYFIEPFIKSRALKLHNDSLLLANKIDDYGNDDKVLLIPYQGVGGIAFDRFFKREGNLKIKVFKDKLEYHF